MSSNDWKFKYKKDLKTKVGRHCSDCKKPILPGSFARRVTYEKKNEEMDFMMYDNRYYCEDCEKYHRRDK